MKAERVVKKERKMLLDQVPTEILSADVISETIAEVHFQISDLSHNLADHLQEILPEDIIKKAREHQERVRVRMISQNMGSRSTPTIKYCVRVGAFKTMYEGKISPRFAVDFFDDVKGSEICKDRYYRDGLRIDVFASRFQGLVLAEKDQEVTETFFVTPFWLVPYIKKEVTGQQEYYHDWLADNGLPPQK